MRPPKEQASGFTYADYRTWPEDERWELIDGVAWNMSPAPARSHQRILLDLAREYWIVNGEARWVMVYRIGADRQYRKPDYYRAGQDGEVILSDVLAGAGIPVDSFL